PRRRRPSSTRRRDRGCPRLDLGTPLTPTPLGRARTDASAERRTDAALAGGDGGLRARAPACPAGPGMTIDPRGVAPSALPGVRYGTIARHGDRRGAFRELWRAGSFPDVTFVQANLSTSSAGVVRGLHLHQHQDDLWVVGERRSSVALVAVRPARDADGPPVVETRELDADSWIYIPTGVAHGFLALAPVPLVHLVPNA